MASTVPMVHVVDDAKEVRGFVSELLSGCGYEVHCYQDTFEFLERFRPHHPQCLLLDVRLPRMSGLELQRRLLEQCPELPVILMTGYGTTLVAVRAFKQGAQDFLEKPIEAETLLDAIDHALEKDRARHGFLEAARLARERLAVLTSREREVFDALVCGLSSKSMAASLHISKKTVDLHRSNVMRKLEAASVTDLVRISLSASAVLDLRT